MGFFLICGLCFNLFVRQGFVATSPVLLQANLSDQNKKILPTSSNIVRIALGEAHSLILDSAGTVFSFGLGDNGQLGIGEWKKSTNSTSRHSIHKIKSLTGIPIASVCAASLFSAALSQSGQVSKIKLIPSID